MPIDEEAFEITIQELGETMWNPIYRAFVSSYEAAKQPIRASEQPKNALGFPIKQHISEFKTAKPEQPDTLVERLEQRLYLASPNEYTDGFNDGVETSIAIVKSHQPCGIGCPHGFIYEGQCKLCEEATHATTPAAQSIPHDAENVIGETEETFSRQLMDTAYKAILEELQLGLTAKKFDIQKTCMLAAIAVEKAIRTMATLSPKS